MFPCEKTGAERRYIFYDDIGPEQRVADVLDSPHRLDLPLSGRYFWRGRDRSGSGWMREGGLWGRKKRPSARGIGYNQWIVVGGVVLGKFNCPVHGAGATSRISSQSHELIRQRPKVYARN